MKKILLDTNMLMSIGTLKVDIFSEIERVCSFPHEVVTLDSNVEELKGIAEKQKLRFKKAARLALQLLDAKKVHVLKSGIMPADEAILKAVGTDWIVATQDLELKKQLAELGVPVIVLRQKKYLKFG